MIIQPDSIVADPDADTSAKAALRAVLREFRSVARLPTHFLREQMLATLEDARIRIDRINAESA